ncbi:hypothetical protein VB620_20600 [Nodularia harveyana UHCC-0300]|uniref:Uncharacterized protein n=1 Tax=Nodularia harveyana UHCC-0300 TaxID=2974287 RepID=A0ABU5UJR2_9CYAN|nr:hypothetical protein [Nodularia harveyana UHCC-0300]
MCDPAFLTTIELAFPRIFTQKIFRVFLTGYFLMQSENPESRFYKVWRIVWANSGYLAIAHASYF